MLVDGLVSRGWNAPLVRKVVLVAGTACGLGIFGAAHAHTATRALLWIGLSIGGLAAAAPVGWSIPALIAPRASVGRLGGIVNFVCQVSGITAQILTGYIVRATHSYALAFGISAVYLLLGIAGYLVLLGRHRADEDYRSLPCCVGLFHSGTAIVHDEAPVGAGGQLDVVPGIGPVEVGDVLGLRVVRRATLIRIM